jgi:CHAT domain-containing protein
MDSALGLLRAARDADPTYLPAQYRYIEMMRYRGAIETLRREYSPSAVGDSPLARCLTTVALAPYHFTLIVQAVQELERNGSASACTDLYLAVLPDGPQQAWIDRGLEYAPRIERAAPELDTPWLAHARLLAYGGHWEEALRTLLEGIRVQPHALGRLLLHLARVEVYLARGDTALAHSVFAAVAAAVERDGRPGLRALLLGQQVPEAWHRPSGQFERHFELLRMARAHGDWRNELSHLSMLGGELVAAGYPARAMSYHDRQVALADSVGAAYHQLKARMQRGRALSKLGLLSEAERELRRAVSAGTGANDPYHLGEAWHNLAHVYEAQGRWPDASRAADRFIALTGPLRYDALRMMSLHDAAIIRWRAGWHASARDAFEEMVRVVDEQNQQHYWAGEYFERIGDLPRALEYYRTGAATGAVENLRGLARVYDRLDQPDSSEWAARAHDSLTARWTAFEMPLMPGVLARRGRLEEAVSVSRAWAARRRDAGDAQAAAVAELQLSELLLAAGRGAEALESALRAERLAARLHFTEELIGARRLSGLALVAEGRTEAGVSALRSAAALASARPTAETVLATHVALGDALGAGGRSREALAAYDRAAGAVEGVTARLEHDVDRVAYRARHLAPFDGAIRVLLSEPRAADRAAALLEWSQRRKGAALALATGEAIGGRAVSPQSADELRRRLGPGDALLDYVVSGSSLAAIVVTRRRTVLVPLAAREDSVRSSIEFLRRGLVATYAGRVDLARARFNTDIGARLYQDLVTPLQPYLGGVGRLLIVPDGVLHYVPFEALVRSPATSYLATRYLLDEYQVLYLPTAHFMSTGAGADYALSRSAAVLAVGFEAPGADRELSSVGAAWSARRVTLLRGERATEGAVRAAATRYALVHFAVHARAEDLDPLASHLRLAADSVSDGLYHVSEIAATRRDARLVVLSGCETLSGRLYSGEGLMGLARAFLSSGASAVVATQWPIGAATAELMGAFHRRLASGETPSAALRDARLELRSRPRTSHPFYWAGFVLVTGPAASR